MSRDGELSAVFDCMLYFQAAISESGPASELLRYAERRYISLFVSREIFQELGDVLSRPQTVMKYPFLTPKFVGAFISRVSQFAQFVTAFPSHFSYLRDPKDEKYINLAVEIEADFIVSRDRDLLDLMTAHTDDAKEFRQRFRRLRIVGPSEFLEIVRESVIALKR